MTLPPPHEPRQIPRVDRPVVVAAVTGGGVAMVAVVVGLTILGWHSEGTNDVAMTGLAAIGSTLAGGFAGWIARRDEPRRDDDRS